MMDGKSAVLARLREALQVTGDDKARKVAVAARLKSAPVGVIPARGQLPDKERIALFLDRVASVNVTVTKVKSLDGVPKAVSEYLRERNLPATIIHGGDQRFGHMNWKSQKTLEVKTGPSDGKDENGLSFAYGGIAETGTFMLVSGADNPTTINFLPENHIVVLEASSIAGDLETLMQRLRQTYGKGEMPRTVNLITGPSRSGDIEQTILLGAHGPRAVHLVLVG